MLNGLAIIAALTNPLYPIGTTIKVLEGDFKDCIGTVVDVYQPPGDNLYDLKLSKCPKLWIKGTYLVERVPEPKIGLSSENK